MTRKTAIFIALAALAFIGVTAAASAATYSSLDSANIWVSAGGGGQPSTLRAWGYGGTSVAPVYPAQLIGDDQSNWTYSYVGWDVSGIAHGNYVVTSATLTLTEYSRTRPYSQADGTAHPIEARALNQVLPYDGQPGWNFSSSSNQNPGGVFGTGDLSNYAATGKFTIPINLLADAGFQSYFNSAVNGSGQIALALTTSLDEFNNNEFYKFYSGIELGHEGDAPLLSVTYTATPEPASLLALLTGIVGALPLLRRRVS